MLSNNIVRGTKRKCVSCGTLFFDLDKMPIICPHCGASVSLLTNVSKRGRPPKVQKNENIELVKNNKIVADLVDKEVRTGTDQEEELLKDDSTETLDIDDENIEDDNILNDEDALIPEEELADESDEVENIIEIERDQEE
tara:strand:+ start:1030 stop:1449 length:420 start_codon:yes stop_codon:yes gene_type:complete